MQKKLWPLGSNDPCLIVQVNTFNRFIIVIIVIVVIVVIIAIIAIIVMIKILVIRKIQVIVSVSHLSKVHLTKCCFDPAGSSWNLSRF